MPAQALSQWVLLTLGVLNLLFLAIGFITLSRGISQSSLLDSKQNGALWKLIRAMQETTMERIKNLVSRLNALIVAVKAILVSLGIIRSKQTVISESLAKIQGDIAFLKDKLENVFINNPDLADAEAALSSLESEVALLDTEVQSVNAEISNAQAAAEEIDNLTPEDADGDGITSDVDQDDNDPNVGAPQP
jgi:peptidoglycan hydrolase CwlO-like protein